MTTSEDAAGMVAERYVLGRRLGSGGMGEVYRATDQVLGREVAIKLLLPIRETPAAVERFEREARAAAMFSDPHVVATYDFGPHGSGYFLTMELVEGCTVSEELRRNGPLSAERAMEIVSQAAAGVAAAHQAGVIHRDLKPANLLLTADGGVKVADFGIARLRDETTTTLTATGQIVGTSHYLSPERALGKPAEASSDVYALGCVLYQLVTGHPPFMGEDPASIMYQHVETEPVPPSELRPELGGEFEAFLFWLLKKDPAQRPTAAQVAQRATPPVDVMSRTDTLVAPRLPSRKILAVACAALTLALAASIGILLEANPRGLPATNDLKPEPSATATAPKPRTTPSASVVVVSPTAPEPPPKQTQAHTIGPKNPVAVKPAEAKPGKPAKPDKQDRPTKQKPEKPKSRP